MSRKCINAIFAGLSIVLSASAVSANSLEYFVTSPDMRWAYQVNTFSTGAVIKFSVPGYQLVATEQGTRLDVPGVSGWTRAGEPRIPVFPAVFKLSADTSYRIEIVPGDYDEESVTNLLAESSLQSRSIDDSASRMVESRTPDPAIYEADAFWPESFYTVNEAKGGGQRYLRIGIQPFKYNPVSGKLRFYPDLEVNISVPASGVSRSDE